MILPFFDFTSAQPVAESMLLMRTFSDRLAQFYEPTHWKDI